MLEPTVRCNLHCITCTRDSVIHTYKKTDVTEEDIDKILSFFPKLDAIKFQGLGEPLLTRNIENILERLTSRKVRLWTISNGTILHKQKYRDLFLNYFRDVTISFDSTSSDLFKKLRVGATIEQVKDGVKIFIADRNLKNREVSIGITFCVSHENVHELGDLYRLAVELGVDYVVTQQVENWTVRGEESYEQFADYAAQALRQGENISRELKKLRLRLMTKGILHGSKSPESRLSKCAWPFKSLFINVEGYVTPCCIRMHRDHSFGNILEAESLEEIWHGDNYQQLRRAHIEKDSSNVLCGACPY
ncbi:radical SAM protein [Gammaproteobacteria bacterium]|nr:radical SAM protein [Gammaproteobacteria bacterium]